jgi:hypothetical protein
MSAELLALMESDPAAGILAVADLREQRAKAATPQRWEVEDWPLKPDRWQVFARMDTVATDATQSDAEHIAAEANPAHALAAVRRWRGVVERHKPMETQLWERAGLGGIRGAGLARVCAWCPAPRTSYTPWPCPDLTETADEARAYVSDGS